MFFPKSVFIMQKVTSRRKMNAARKQKNEVQMQFDLIIVRIDRAIPKNCRK